jgi:sugar phosphate isomerase/epimerase
MSEKWPIGVFASIDAGLGVKLEVARDLGVHTVHLHTPHAKSRTPERAVEFNKRLADLGIKITCVFAGFEGESYADIPIVERTVGLTPPATRPTRTAELKEIADFTCKLGVNVLGMHLGFVPHDRNAPDYRTMVDLTRGVCDHCERNGQALHLETGQEPVDVLIGFLDDVERDNIFVNFDPANMILYGAGEPIPALERLGSRVHSIHCKDATWSDQPGKTWGREVPLGQGDVDMTAFVGMLKKIGYTGPLTIEREIPQEPERQKAEIGGAIALLEKLKKQFA